MFAFIKGSLEHIDNNYIIVEANGVGYKIYTSFSTVAKLPQLSHNVKIHTYLHVREDIMDLFGFMDRDELSMFELLISVSGVGPKAALSILSTVTPANFALAVVTSDFKTITKAQGIGSKLAQRIVLELKDKIKNDDLVSSHSNLEISDQAGSSSEAVSALMVLGYSQAEANNAVQAVKTAGMELEEIIKLALKKLMK